ncbi:MAG: hypothetical protein M1531_01370 [Chloroflexi bacterium]|nr:hypothetical protein [Chloroflexota bacterium]
MHDPDYQPDAQATPSPRPPGATPSPSTRSSHRLGWLAAVVIALAALVAVGVTVPPGAPLHHLVAAVAPIVPADSQAAAIQAVIQRANQEQAQALAQGDPSLMSDTATAAYYRELVQTNQQLAAQGVTSINLVRLTWGSINVTGTNATATTDETWTTTFNDGTTAESTDPNIYTLVLQGGKWLIAADQHPTPSAAPTPASGGTPPAAQPTPLPPSASAPSPQDSSRNWAGYAATSGTFTGVTGTWIVPQPVGSGGAGVGATWVGIGGVTSTDLIQAGTQDVSSGNQDQFQTWIEMLPQASQQVPVAVVPGDSVTVSINEQGAGTGVWQISIKNNTNGQSYQQTVNYASSESSAEWIEEAPSSGRGGILPLDNFGSVSFSGATAIRNGQTVDLSQAGAQPITMINANNQALAVSSAIASDGKSFTVSRTSAASTTGRGGSLGRPPRSR